jgi:hypothetical protein
MQTFLIIFGLVLMVYTAIEFCLYIADKDDAAQTMAGIASVALFFIGLLSFGAGCENKPTINDVIEGKAKIVTLEVKKINIETNDTITTIDKHWEWIKPKYE